MKALMVNYTTASDLVRFKCKTVAQARALEKAIEKAGFKIKNTKGCRSVEVYAD